MKTVRQYVVDSHLPGCLPDRAEPVEPCTSEEVAIEAFKEAVIEALDPEDSEDTSDFRVKVMDEVNAINIGLVLSLKIGEEIATEINGRRYYLGRVEDADSFDSKEEAVEAINARPVPLADPKTIAEREARISHVASLIRYVHENLTKMLKHLSDFEKGERNGILFSVLLSAGVPYAVEGEMRPAREWINAHQAMSIIILDKRLDPVETATWLVDQPHSKPALPTQSDYAEQPRTSDIPESGPVGGDNRPNTGDFFLSREAGAGETIIES